MTPLLCASVYLLENGEFSDAYSGTRADFLSVKGLLHALHWSHSETLSGRKELNYQLGLLTLEVVGGLVAKSHA